MFIIPASGRASGNPGGLGLNSLTPAASFSMDRDDRIRRRRIARSRWWHARRVHRAPVWRRREWREHHRRR
jgi:hypothetical protein